jgi:hypothetical protein
VSDQNELYYAHMEADRNEAEKAYFEARPSLGAEVDRALFRAGFERAYAKLWPLWIIQLNEQQRASQETSAVTSNQEPVPSCRHGTPNDRYCGFCD